MAGSETALNLKPGVVLFVRCAAGPFFVARIITVDSIRTRCYVRSEYDKTHWIYFKNVQKRDTPPDVCSLCLKSGSSQSKPLLKCTRCCLGFHSACHRPVVGDLDQTTTSRWQCQACVYVITGCKNETFSKPLVRVGRNTRNSVKTKQLPSRTGSLGWDDSPQVHSRDVCCCYCGKSGSGLNRMLKCCKCLQWFHQACIVLKTDSLISGDLGYIFFCTFCIKQEFYHRIQTTWADLAHLALFNLGNQKKRVDYHGLQSEIVPWINVHWNNLHAGKLKGTPPNDREQRILEALEKNMDSRFMKGRSKQSASIWRLRDHRPLDSPDVDVSALKSPLTVKAIQQHLSNKTSVQKSSSSAAMKRKPSKGDNSEMKPPELKRMKKTDPYERQTRNKTKKVASSHVASKSSDVCDPKSTDQTKASGGTGTSGTLEEIIPMPCSYEGVDHPFKTMLERTEEIETTELRQMLLTSCVGKSSGMKSGETGIKRPAPVTAGKRQGQSKLAAARHGSSKDLPFGFNGVDVANHLMHPKNVIEKSAIDGVSEEVIPMEHLRSLVGSYFGAASRLDKGERFKILGRRTTSGDKVQYLVQWEGGLIT